MLNLDLLLKGQTISPVGEDPQPAKTTNYHVLEGFIVSDLSLRSHLYVPYQALQHVSYLTGCRVANRVNLDRRPLLALLIADLAD